MCVSVFCVYCMWMCMYMYMSHVCHSHLTSQNTDRILQWNFPPTLEVYSIIWQHSYNQSLRAAVLILSHRISINISVLCTQLLHCVLLLQPQSFITLLFLFLPACQPSCATCENDFECTACGGSFFLSGRQCVTTCERGLFQDHTRCLSKSTAV